MSNRIFYLALLGCLVASAAIAQASVVIAGVSA